MADEVPSRIDEYMLKEVVTKFVTTVPKTAYFCLLVPPGNR